MQAPHGYRSQSCCIWATYWGKEQQQLLLKNAAAASLLCVLSRLLRLGAPFLAQA